MQNPEIKTIGQYGEKYKYDLTGQMSTIKNKITIVTSEGDQLTSLPCVVYTQLGFHKQCKQNKNVEL